MAARRLIVIMLVLLVMSSITAALLPQTPRTSDSQEPATTTTTVPAERGGRLIQRTMRADRPTRETIEISLGDQLALQVTSSRATQVSIPRIGELADVDPNAPARFDLFPTEPGIYPVKRLNPAREVGRIVVRDGAATGGEGPNEGQPGAGGGSAGPPPA